MQYEKPQKRNPHQLTVRQHVFPQFCIKRFCNTEGSVSYYDKQTGLTNLKTPRDVVFCAMRVWDQRAEAGYMKSIEDKYECLSNRIIDGDIKTLTPEHQNEITEMFCIWNLRHFYKKNPILDQKLHGVLDQEPKFSKDEQEQLEKNHIGYIKEGAVVPGRDIAGVQLQLRLFDLKKRFSDGNWGIIRSNKDEFIVPDNFNKGILPLSPNICLIFACDNMVIDSQNVAQINSWAVESSTNYYFAKDLSACPTIDNSQRQG
ncbi:MAG: hypothetical protein AUJ47_07575 [Candidatus Marinimicrobia bacterium CG1_02_48_14]|nr:MAG: hypothetical protein AUJ47_07575 [Candidatus Marinimicrobia bacterium CG1_02_48_14]